MTTDKSGLLAIVFGIFILVSFDALAQQIQKNQPGESIQLSEIKNNNAGSNNISVENYPKFIPKTPEQKTAVKELHELYNKVVEKEKKGMLNLNSSVKDNGKINIILESSASDYDFTVKMREAGISKDIIAVFNSEIQNLLRGTENKE